jgi:ubiquinone/menaquinone biosynthesis C-methylase UbiE
MGRRQAAQRGADVDWREADAEALPFADGEFDVVTSCVGVMFAPHHQAAADELVRVCRPGGTVGLISWTPGGFVGQMLAAMRPFVPPPPAGAQPPTLWGEEEHVRALLGDRITDVTTKRLMVTIDRFGTPADFREYFKANYGPTAAAYRGLADEPERSAALDAALDELAVTHNRSPEGLTMDWEYLLLTARRSG